MAIDTKLLHTTPMGEERIRRNLGLTVADIIAWCSSEVGSADEGAIVRRGKNWYVYRDGFTLTSTLTATRLSQRTNRGNSKL